jgi:hypothetical protein
VAFVQVEVAPDGGVAEVGRRGAPIALTEPVSVNVAQTSSPAGNCVMCSTAVAVNITPGTDGLPGGGGV